MTILPKQELISASTGSKKPNSALMKPLFILSIAIAVAIVAVRPDQDLTSITENNRDDQYNLYFVGVTGHGKSTIASNISTHLGASDVSMFNVSAKVTSTVHEDVISYTNGTFTILDTPGLLDSAGLWRDDVNLRMIVDDVQKRGTIAAVFYVIREQEFRLNDGHMKAIKLIIDSFGSDVLQNFAFVFSFADGKSFTSEESFVKAGAFRSHLAEQLGLYIPTLKSFQIESRLDRHKGKSTPEHIAVLEEQYTQSLDEMLEWARSRTPLNTTFAVYGEYEEQKSLREARVREEEAKTEASRQAEIAAHELQQRLAAEEETARQTAKAEVQERQRIAAEEKTRQAQQERDEANRRANRRRRSIFSRIAREIRRW